MNLKDGDLVIHEGEVKEVDWVRQYTIVVKGREGMMVVPLDRIKPYVQPQTGGMNHG